jgi:hypothetical protein
MPMKVIKDSKENRLTKRKINDLAFYLTNKNAEIVNFY